MNSNTRGDLCQTCPHLSPKLQPKRKEQPAGVCPLLYQQRQRGGCQQPEKHAAAACIDLENVSRFGLLRPLLENSLAYMITSEVVP